MHFLVLYACLLLLVLMLRLTFGQPTTGNREPADGALVPGARAVDAEPLRVGRAGPQLARRSRQVAVDGRAVGRRQLRRIGDFGIFGGNSPDSSLPASG